MMFRLLAFALIIILPIEAIASSQDAGQTLLGTHDVLRGHFTEERHLEGFNGPMKSEGHFVIMPSRGLIWTIEKPFLTTTIITPAGLSQSANGKQMTRITAQKVPFLLHLYDMLGGALAGNWKPLEADFDIVRSGDVQNWQATLSPHPTDNNAMPFNAITVSGHRFVENVLLSKSDGDSDTLHFFDQVISQSPPSAAEIAAFDSVTP